MRALSLLTVCVPFLAACATTDPQPSALDARLQSMRDQVDELERAAARRQPADLRAPQAQAQVASGPRPAAPAGETRPALPPGLATLDDGPIEIRPEEVRELTDEAMGMEKVSATELAAWFRISGVTASGLRRSLKVLHLMSWDSKSALMRQLKPDEHRCIMTHEVHLGRRRSLQRSAPLPTAPGAAGSAGRYTQAGTGVDGWRTLLDTATGTIYNFRRDGKESRWVAITNSLAEQQLEPDPDPAKN